MGSLQLTDRLFTVMAKQDPPKDTTCISGLQEKLQSLGVESPIPSFEGANVLTNPVDIHRSYLAEALTKVLDCDRQLVYDAIQWTNQLSNGDLLVVVPRLGMKAVKPAEVTKDLSDKVCNQL